MIKKVSSESDSDVVSRHPEVVFDEQNRLNTEKKGHSLSLKKDQSEFSGYLFKDEGLCLQALTHKSFVYEGFHKGKKYNETLEFLGDAVLDLILSRLLMKNFPEANEGILSKKRASLVNETVLAKIATDLNLGERMFLGKGEVHTGGRTKPRLLASVYEALVGAAFIETDYATVEKIVEPHFRTLIHSQTIDESFEADYKTKFQEVVQADLRCGVTYKTISEKGLSHEPVFESAAMVLEREVGRGIGKSKKASEQAAAQKSLEDWNQNLISFGVRKKNV